MMRSKRVGQLISVFGALFILAIAVPSALMAQWNADQRLSADTSASLNENMGQCLAISGDSLHVLWVDYKVDGGAIFYKHSYDAGKTWSVDARLTPSPSYVGFASIATCGNFVHVAYRDTTGGQYVSFYKRSTDGGNTWSAPVSLGAYYWWPSITCDGSDVYVALNSNTPGNSEVWFRRSRDNGATWEAVVQISNAAGRSEDPSISASVGLVHLAWNDNRTGTMQTWYRSSTNAGTTWGPETQITTPAGGTYCPIVHASELSLDVAYGAHIGSTFEIFYKQSTDFGATWTSDIQLSHAGATSVYPVVARSGSNVHVVWWQFSGGAVYDHSTDGGATWATPTTLMSASNTPTNPFICASGSKLHAVWLDKRTGHPEVYYMNNISSSTKPGSITLQGSLKFNTLGLNETSTSTITLTNSGTTAVHILRYSLSDPSNAFDLDDTAAHTIAANGSATISVRFHPMMAQTYSATITINTDETASPNSHQVSITGTAAASDFRVQQSYDFGTYAKGSKVSTGIKMYNRGAAPVNILQYQLFDTARCYTLVDTSTHTIAGNDSATMIVMFNPTDLQKYNESVLIYTDAPLLNLFYVELQGTGAGALPSLSSQSVDFGSIVTGNSQHTTVSINNDGTLAAGVVFYGIAGSKAFSLDSSPIGLSIPANSKVSLAMTYKPSTVGTDTALLSLEMNDGSYLYAHLSGQGTTAAAVRPLATAISLLEVSPNPARDHATLRIGSSRQLDNLTIEFYDNAGRLLQSQVVGAIGEGIETIALSPPQVSGILFVRIVSAGETVGATEIAITH